MKTAFVFAGQGAQYIGMGKDFYDQFSDVREMYHQASKILGFDVPSLCFEDNDKLMQTKYTQPCIVITSCAIYEVITRQFNLQPVIAAGFSLGEYSALYASNIYNFKDIIKLIKYRALYMDEAANKYPGKMAAIIGADELSLQELCEKIGDVQIANYNSPNQLVISGKSESVEKVCALIKTRKVVPLNVSGAFHSPLMAEAAEKMYSVVKNTPFQKPLFPVITNVTGEILNLNKLPETLCAQIKSPVLWVKTINTMTNDYQVEKFIEIGPGKVLSGLIKKIAPNKKTISINNIQDLQFLREDLS